MARLARVVVPRVPHHVTQRGNRRQQTFFCDEDHVAYLGLLGEWLPRRGVELWAYCLMPNHVHLVAVPESADGLRRAIGEVHRRYSRRVNFREGWRGHLWQGRFASFPMDDAHTLDAARTIELNPVRAAWRRRRRTTDGAVHRHTLRPATTGWCEWPRSSSSPAGLRGWPSWPKVSPRSRPSDSVATSARVAHWAMRGS